MTKINKEVVCSGSGKQINDITFSEIMNKQFLCPECCDRLRFPDGTPTKGEVKIVIPRHSVPSRVTDYRAALEYTSGSESRRAK